MPATDVQLRCLEAQAPMFTTVRFLDGWSLSTHRSVGDGRCYAAEAFNSYPDGESAVIIKREPDDCIAVPEPAFDLFAFAVVVMFIIIFKRTA